ncbi:MAG: hypothetical protein OTJ44_02990 [Planctomycetota bacterium]|nr:hypothetical protein [Planctomycetota bacterium]
MKTFFIFSTVALLATYGFFSFRTKQAEAIKQKNQQQRERNFASAANIPQGAIALETPRIRLQKSPVQFFVPSQPIDTLEDSESIGALRRAQGFEETVTRYLAHVYRELREPAAGDGDIALKQTVLGAQLHGAFMLFREMKKGETEKTWGIVAPRVIHWMDAVFLRLLTDWEKEYPWVASTLAPFREEFHENLAW